MVEQGFWPEPAETISKTISRKKRSSIPLPIVATSYYKGKESPGVPNSPKGSPGPSQGITNRRDIKPEGPYKIRTRFEIGQIMSRLRRDLFLRNFESMSYLIWALRRPSNLLFRGYIPAILRDGLAGLCKLLLNPLHLRLLKAGQAGMCL